MSQHYILVNAIKAQALWPMLMKAKEIIQNGSFQRELALLLLDLGKQEQSLEKDCQRHLATHKEEYPEGTFQLLPRYQQQMVDKTQLQEVHHVGAWAGDRLIVIGDHCEAAPFPPNGEWKRGNLFNYMHSHSNPTPDVLYIYAEDNKESLATLKMLCEGKVHLVVNLDKKEYLDPRAYGGQTNVLDYDKIRCSILSDLIIKLTYSTGSGSVPDSITSQGVWAGDRIVICTAEQLDDFESFKDVSSTEDVKHVQLWGERLEFPYHHGTPIWLLKSKIL